MKSQIFPVLIGVGSNIKPESNIEKALLLLSEHVLIEKVSTFFWTNPIGAKNQDQYLNGIFKVHAFLSPRDLKSLILKPIEKKLGRKKTQSKFSSRTIDLDILIYGDKVIQEDDLRIPDPDIYSRPFLSRAIYELEPNFILPETDKKIQEVCKNNETKYKRAKKFSKRLKVSLSEIGYYHQKYWEKEYKDLRGIHLEYQETVPEVVTLFHDLKQENDKRSIQKILDVGCGKGRIGLHLAKLNYQVACFDFSKTAIKELKQIARNLKMKYKIKVLFHNMMEKWPFDNHSMDSIFAVTVIDNLIYPDQLIHFKNEVLRVLRPNGLLVIEWYLKDDGYYGELLKKFPITDNNLVYDPNNQLFFRILDKKYVLDLFKYELKLVVEKKYFPQSYKYGKTYQRSSQILILKRK